MVEKWAYETDLVIMGSGAGAMTAAIIACDKGLDVMILEKSPYCGGSSAMSGGVVWVPNNHLMQAAGIQDSPEDAYDYLSRCVAGRTPEEKLRTYLHYAPQMLSYLHDTTDVRFYTLPEYPDYYPEMPGGKPGGRSCEALPYNGLLLDEAFDKLRPPHPQETVFGRIMLTAPEARLAAGGGIQAVLLMADLMLGYALNLKARFRGTRDSRLCLGNALAGRLFNSVLDRDISVWLNTPVTELLIEDDSVVGVTAEFDGETRRIKARKGVLLAAGGFERNLEMRQQYQRSPVSTEWTAAHPYNTGDAIRMGQQLGAALDLMDEAWWTPTTVVPDGASAWMLIIEKNLPGSIIVDHAGKRYTNEAAPYVDVVNAIHRRHSKRVSAVPSYLVFDSRYRRKYPAGPLLPGMYQPDWVLPRRIHKHFLHKEDTLLELAASLGIDADRLETTMIFYNEYVDGGEDRDFQRGASLYDRYYGDASVKPNPSLGSINKPPYYGFKVFPGDLGTKGGLLTDRFGRVQRVDGSLIPGLYATGNCTASIMGRSYPGAGATLGPAMTFGYLAALHAAGQLEGK